MSVKEQQPNIGGYASELDKLVSSIDITVSSTVKSIISQTFSEVIGNYLTTEENKVREVVSSLSDNVKKGLEKYLDFFTKSGKIYGYAFGIVLRNIGYIPRTLEDLFTRPINQTADRETRNAARYASLLLYGMLPKKAQAIYSRMSPNLVSETVLRNLEEELIYLGQYLSEVAGAKEEEIKNIIQLIDSLMRVPAIITTQMYSALSKVFTPEITGSMLASPYIIETTKELHKKFYNNVIKILGTESKKEVIETVKPEKESVKEQEKVESKKEATEVTEQKKEVEKGSGN